MAVVLAACSSGSGSGPAASTSTSRPPSATSAPRSTTTTAPVQPITRSSQDLQGRRFWFGDADGSLFQIDLARAELRPGTAGNRLVLTGTARNLLVVPARFDISGRARVGARAVAVEVDRGPRVDPGASAPIRLLATGVSADATIGATTLVFGPTGTNQAVVPLAAGSPVQAEAPQLGVIDPAPFAVARGATMRVVTSVLYPRFGAGRVGQHRLKVGAEIDLAAGVEDGSVFVHPSITAPDGNTESLGPQQVFGPTFRLVGSAIVNPPIEGPYRLDVLDVSTGATATRSFRVG